MPPTTEQAWQSGSTHGFPRLAFDALGSGPPLVLLHGVGSDRRTWRSQAPLARQLGVSLVAWDARGYGGSEATPEFTLPQCVSDLANLLDHLGVKSAVLAGHSMGGLIAQQFAALHPARVQALVLVSTTQSLRRSLNDAQLDQFLAERRAPLTRGVPLAELAPQIVSRLVAPEAPAPVIAQAVEMLSAIDPCTYVRALEAVTRDRGLADLSAVRAPTLVVVGALDTLTPPSAADALARGIPAAELHVVPHAAHMLPLEAPLALNTRMAEFLDRVRGGAQI